MKSFKSIREGNSVEPGVSEIDDVPEDPLSYVEIKPKKTKVVKEGIVDTAANAKVRIFSSIDRKKKELYKNAVKEDIQEAISVKKEKYSWGKMMTVHHGSDTSYPLHPEHQQAIAKLGDGEKTSFKDETNSSVHAEREGDTVHLTRPRTSSTKTSVAHSHFNEELEQGVAEATVATKHRIGLTVTDPNHPMVSKRGETYQKSVRVTGDDREKAINSAIAHYRRKGYKVHDHNYMGTVDQGVAEGSVDKKPYPKTWHDVDPKIGKLVDKMSPEEKVKKGYSNPSILKKKKEQGVAENVAGDVNSKERYHVLYPHVPLDMHKDHEYNKLSDRDLQAVKSHQRELADKLGEPGAEKQSDIASHIQINRARSQHDQEQAHRRKILDAEKVKRQAREAKRKQQGVAEAFPNPGSGSTGSSKEDKRIAAALRKKHIPYTPNDKKKGVAEETLSELKKDTLSSYMAKARKDVDKKQKEIVGHRRNNNAIDARKTMSKTMTRFNSLDRARTRLNKEETEQVVTEEWTKTGKIGTHIASGEKTFEWAKVDSEGRETGERHYRNAAGKVMGEEVVAEGIKSKIAGMALSALAAHGAAHGRVTFDDQGGHSGGYKPTATATATSTPSDNKPAAENPSGLSKEYLQRAADPNRFGRHMHLISPEKAAEHLKKMKEDKKQVVETKGAPKGFHFTKDGKLKRGDANQDGDGGPMLRSDPLDKQRNKVPAVSEGIDFFKVWESIKPEEVLVEEETVDPVALKKEADRIMELNIAARKAK